MNWLRYKSIYFLISGTLIIVSIFSLSFWGLRIGLDFRGGSVAEYRLEKPISTEETIQKLKVAGIEVNSIQRTKDGTYFFKLATVSPEQREEIKKILEQELTNRAEELRFETVGPSIGPELIKKTVYAIIIATAAILLWVAYQFKNFKFGLSAVLAMLHDSFILIGSFSLLGHFYKAEVDFLFVTALLTTLSFSVHDTIVVFDRIREIDRKFKGNVLEVANKALTETMVRSLNNSFTIIFMLVALLLLGGSTIRWFAAALLIGTILGTYSSPFVAVPLLVSWDKLKRT